MTKLWLETSVNALSEGVREHSRNNNERERERKGRETKDKWKRWCGVYLTSRSWKRYFAMELSAYVTRVCSSMKRWSQLSTLLWLKCWFFYEKNTYFLTINMIPRTKKYSLSILCANSDNEDQWNSEYAFWEGYGNGVIKERSINNFKIIWYTRLGI